MKARLGKVEGIAATAHSRAERDSQMAKPLPEGGPPEGGSNLARILYIQEA